MGGTSVRASIIARESVRVSRSATGPPGRSERMGGLGGRLRQPSLSMSRDPRVDERLREVDGEVEEDEERGEHEDHALEHGKVPLEDREVHQVAGAGPRE